MKLPEIGSTFQSRYRLDSLLGAGGFATVFGATDIAAERDVAIKILKPELTGYPADVRSRFDREVEVVANLRDEHTITMFDYGTSDDGLLYMVTEFVPGMDLSTLLEHRGRLEPHEVVHIVRQVLASLREAHAAGLLHRDIKPENIRVYEYSGDPLRAKLLDFGIAKPLEGGAAITQDGAIVGTPRYMSPEQLLQGKLSPASDIYSLGVVAFELLMGSDRIHGTQLSDQLNRLATGHMFSVPELQRIGPELCRILDRMAAREPSDRFGTADEVLGALNALTRRPPSQPLPAHQGRAAMRPQTIGSSDLVPVQNTSGAMRPPTGMRPSTGSLDMPRPVPQTDPGFEIAPRDAEGNNRGLIVVAVALVCLAGAGIAAAVQMLAESDADRPVATTRQAPGLIQNSDPPRPEPTVEAATQIPSKAPAFAGDVGAPDAGGERVRSYGCGSSSPGLTGLGKLQIVDGLTTRPYDAYVPKSYDPQRPHPLIMMFHENAESPLEFIQFSRLAELSEKHGIVLIAPFGGFPYAWQDGKLDSIAVAQTALQDALDHLCIDTRRIYFLGHAAGGKVVEQSPCHFPQVDAIATTSYRGPGSYPSGVCVPEEPRPYLHIAPLKDKYNPVEGGPSCSGDAKKTSLATKEEFWRNNNACSGARKVWYQQYDGTCYTWSCEEPFVSCHLDAGRGWNGAPDRKWDYADCDGPNAEFEYAQAIWKFFEQHGPD